MEKKAVFLSCFLIHILNNVRSNDKKFIFLSLFFLFFALFPLVSSPLPSRLHASSRQRETRSGPVTVSGPPSRLFCYVVGVKNHDEHVGMDGQPGDFF